MRYKIKAITPMGMFFVLELTNGKTRIIDKSMVTFIRQNSAKKFKVSGRGVAGFKHINCFNCNFPTNFYAIIN